jgi:hypothetical protein
MFGKRTDANIEVAAVQIVNISFVISGKLCTFADINL